MGYVFSDKTGTLTQNDMVLRRLSIGGKKYGTFAAQAGQVKMFKMCFYEYLYHNVVSII